MMCAKLFDMILKVRMKRGTDLASESNQPLFFLIRKVSRVEEDLDCWHGATVCGRSYIVIAFNSMHSRMRLTIRSTVQLTWFFRNNLACLYTGKHSLTGCDDLPPSGRMEHSHLLSCCTQTDWVPSWSSKCIWPYCDVSRVICSSAFAYLIHTSRVSSVRSSVYR